MKYSHEIESFPIMTDIREKRATKVRDGFYEESLRLEDNEELLSQYYRDVTRYLGVFGINKAYFEDAVQDTMVEALAGAERIRDKDKSKSWILTIAKRVGLKYVKQGKSEEATKCSYEEIVSNRVEELEFISDRQLYDQMSRISDESLLEILETTLNIRERRIIMLYYVYGHKFKEIAEILNEPESTVRSVSARAKKKLKAGLEQGGFYHGK